MKADWKKVKLGEITSNIQTGPFGSQLHMSDYSDEGTPVVMPKDIINGKISESSIARVSENHVKRLNRYVVFTGNILYARRGNVGKCAYVSEKENGWLCGTGCLNVESNLDVVDSKFLFFQLQTPETVGWIQKNAVGATMLNLNTEILSRVPISLPPLETQQKIASILSAYDDLIENNCKQIKLLEEAAQRLYKEWFVDLRFPGYENVAIVDGVPEGWRKEKLGSLLPIVTGKKDANFGTKDGMYPFFTCSQEPIKAPSYSFDANAILLAGNGDLNVKIFRGKFEAYQRTYVLVPNEQEHLFICYRTVQDNLRKLIHGASGSTIKFITKGMIENIDVIIPQDEILIKFNILSDNILKKMEKLQRQIYLSQQTRDKLLPRLMSGEIEV